MAMDTTSERLMKKITIIISNQSDCRIVLLHYSDDPLSWIVRKWVRKGFWRTRTESRWFNHRDVAEKYAKQLALECTKGK
jgi:hypothetical protein